MWCTIEFLVILGLGSLFLLFIFTIYLNLDMNANKIKHLGKLLDNKPIKKYHKKYINKNNLQLYLFINDVRNILSTYSKEINNY